MVHLCLRKRTSVRSDANRRLRGFTGREFLSKALPNLLRPEGADAVQAKCKDYAVFVAQPHIEGVILHGDGAALPRVTERRSRADERSISRKGMLLKIKKERRATE